MFCKHKIIKDNCLTRQNSDNIPWNIYSFCMLCDDDKLSYCTVSESCPEWRSPAGVKLGERIKYSDEYEVREPCENGPDKVYQVLVTEGIQNQFLQKERKMFLKTIMDYEKTFDENEKKYRMLNRLKTFKVYMVED